MKLLDCLAAENTFLISKWGPTRARVHFDAKFATWQPDKKADIIEKKLAKLAKLANHYFVHFDSGTNGGNYEIVIAVRGDGKVDAFLANFLENYFSVDEPTGGGARAWSVACSRHGRRGTFSVASRPRASSSLSSWFRSASGWAMRYFTGGMLPMKIDWPE
ncbi:MAG: hypothetical protein JWO36_2476 [Myxococcales bacterium]|nr:hypothetical protein [Myxococcales bacterium]